jgi:hypothetical protein
MRHFRKGLTVTIVSDNENYTDFMNRILIVTNVTKDKTEHSGYDSSLSPEYLYDLKTVSGENVPFSLYDYELKAI